MKVAMILSPGEIFQVYYVTRVDGVLTSCRGARRATVTELGALVSGIGGMIGCVGG